ncbi:MAG: D-alanyl-D-alanine carboxypeptidase [Lachnospiraceae bacterium]|nr:D-alanyl-D-alanine carboxypeptidase [Lachnospiraceae bacterium]
MDEIAPQEQTEEAQQDTQESEDNSEDIQENTEEKDVDTVSQSETPDEIEPAEEPAVEEAQNTESAAGATDVTQVDDSLGITAPSAVLIEASTGTVILEKNSHEKLPPASVTKIMTLLLIFDAVSQGKIKLEDTVTTSTYAASMGGSQVFLEEGESQSVDTMIKCISVASANDASVAYRYSRHFS